MTHYSLVHKFIPVPLAMKNSGCESSSEQGMVEARKVASVAIEQGEEQKGGYSGSAKRQRESPLFYFDGHLSSQKKKKRGVGTNISEV